MNAKTTDRKKLRPQRYAIVGAGISGLACARTLHQAGHEVTIFEKSHGPGGRMSTRQTEWGSFDHGAQYFTVRDPRFAQVINWSQTMGWVEPWQAAHVNLQVQADGVVQRIGARPHDPHWVATPGMNALVKAWAEPLQAVLHTRARVLRIERHAQAWRLAVMDEHEQVIHHDGFDALILAIPAPQAEVLLETGKGLGPVLQQVRNARMEPCWAMMLAFPTPVDCGFDTAHSNHHRVAWLARESSKPQRKNRDRWVIHASAEWSRRHVNDAADRVQAKLIKAFAELTGHHAVPMHAVTHRWLYALTRQTAQTQGHAFVWEASSGIGLCGDWCTGPRIEDAFVSGLELALHLVQ